MECFSAPFDSLKPRMRFIELLQEGVAYLFITHNFGVVEYLAHDIAVMKDGKLVEYGAAEQS